MTPDELADLHARCFDQPRPWSATEFRDLLGTDSTSLIARDHAFALLQIAADTCEILTLAVAPEQRRNGLASELLSRIKDHAADNGCRSILLEVAEHNVAALALYTKCGFTESAVRKDYYRQNDGKRVSARVLICSLDGCDPA